MPNTTTDLYTIVKNTSGGERFFGFLGVRGARLENNATFTVPGDLVTQLGSTRRRRKFSALENALNTNQLEIVKSPSVYLLSETGNVTKELALNSSGNLGTTTPSWDGGSAFSPTAGETGATGPAGATGPTGPAGT